MLGYLPDINHLQRPATCSAWVMFLMSKNMVKEARCQEDLGINAELKGNNFMWNILVINVFEKSL